MSDFVMEFPIRRLIGRTGKGKEGRLAADLYAEELEAEIADAAPYDTGELSRSVDVRAVVRTPNPRVIVTTVEHGLYNEFGTVNMAAQPFVRPTVRSTRQAAESRAVQAARDELEIAEIMRGI